ncbi:hypothetical protein KIW84_020955 [Lathyrus oleraceus]|uniref:Uncharacterized protein n=1 Tax=Pisum sativum TaxID=3888 RepID=A0A9D5B4T1_PEA|nr:hypothetical protein KIW84_020955 [Pisum sativum]
MIKLQNNLLKITRRNMVEIIKFSYVMIILFFLFLIGMKIEGKFNSFILNFVFYFYVLFFIIVITLLCVFIAAERIKCFDDSDCKNRIFCRTPFKRKCINNSHYKCVLAHELLNPRR